VGSKPAQRRLPASEFQGLPTLCETAMGVRNDPVELQTSGWFVYKVQRSDSVSSRHDAVDLAGAALGAAGFTGTGSKFESQPR